MKNFYTLLTALGMMLIIAHAEAQTANIESDVLQWEVDGLYDSAANTSVDFTCQFITYPDSKIVWIQKDDYTSEFTIRSSSSDWTDPSVSGVVDYNVKYADKRGTLRISRVSDLTQIRMYFIDDNKNIMPYIFHVKSVTKKL